MGLVGAGGPAQRVKKGPNKPNKVSEQSSMKKVATLTVRQDPDEPKLKVGLYKGDPHFYISVESHDPRIPPFMPMRIRPTDVADAKTESEKLLYIIRGVFRQALGKTPDLPEHMKELESEIPAFLHDLLTHDVLGQN